jgi:hypothetical protein
MNEFVATEFLSSKKGSGSGSDASSPAVSRPRCLLYASQLRAMFARLFERSPHRPIFTLLNYCRSGGALEFLRREPSRAVLGVDRWPLFLAASSQAEHDALVGGLWDPWFEHLTKAITSGGSDDGGDAAQSSSPSTGNAGGGGGGDGDFPQRLLAQGDDLSLKRLYYHACRSYFESCVYELSDHVVTLAIPDRYEQYVVAFRTDLNRLLVAGPHGTPDFEALEAMQHAWETGKRFKRKVILRKPYNWDKRASLTKAVRKAQLRCAIPEFAVGGCEIEKYSVRLLFCEQQSS